MAEAIFNYEGINILVQCNINDKIKDIIHKFLIKIKKKEDNSNLIYLYNGTSINKELTFEQQANDLDKSRKKMNIIVTTNDIIASEEKIILSNDIICIECKENILLNIKNFKINLFGCKTKNNYYNIL